jgi:hypothetical protein
MSSIGLNKMTQSPQVLNNQISRLEMSGKKSLSNTKKILHKSGSNILPNIVTDYILQELENLEKITLFMY